VTAGLWDIEVRDLSYTYPDGTPGLSGVTLSVPSGQSVAILGPNGAGKSTLLLALPGLILGSGQIHIAGIALTPKSVREVRKRIGIVFQNPDDQLFCPTIYDDAAFGPQNMGLPDDEVHARVGSALAAMGLMGYEDRSSHHLSIGEKKRASIATILTMDPDIIAFDEPSANLDPEGVHDLKKVIASITKTKLIVTHDIALARALATRGVVMRNGTIIEDMPMSALASDYERLKRLRLSFD
jgi:energy-coupling factor transporter ATP-binding protein EcfA2